MPRLLRQDVETALAGRFHEVYGRFTTLRLSYGQWVGACPLHGGDGPNFKMKPETGRWHCYSQCGEGGSIFDFLMKMLGVSFPEALEQAAGFAGLSSGSAYRQSNLHTAVVKPVVKQSRTASILPAPVPLDPILAQQMHRRLMKWDWMRGWLLQERGLTTETLERFQVGMHKDDRDQGFYRITFPVYDRQGRLMNIRRHLFGYLPELTDERRGKLEKTKPWKSGLRAELYPVSVLDGAREALIVEGEADALLACQMGFAAVTGTGGAGTWKPHWTEELRGLSRVTILYDADTAGEAGIPKVAGPVSAVVPDVRVARYTDIFSR